jgi:hypothetical protein
MAWTQTDLDRLDAAIASNVRTVTYADGRTVTYQDVDKMLQLRMTMRGEVIGDAARATPRTRTIIGRFCRR